MPEITVEQLAKIVGTPPDKLLLQMKEAGLGQSKDKDLVSDDDKKVLLNFLKAQQSKESKTISLKKKKPTEVQAKVTSIAIKRKKVKKESTDGGSEQEIERIDFDEIEKKRVEGEEFRKSEEERKKKEAQNKDSVKRKVKSSQAKITRTKPSKEPEKDTQKKAAAKETKKVLSKQEQKELEGEEFLSKEANRISEHAFEKPTKFISKKVRIYLRNSVLLTFWGIFK